MSISHDDVERIIRLLEASQFDELHLELDGFKLDLRRRGAAPATSPAVLHTALVPPPSAATPVLAAASAAKSPPPAAPPAADIGLVDVKAPMLGTFFLSPKPGAEPFVTVGSRVDRDTVIGIVEVMKLMNSVAAGVSGEVVEIVAPEAQLVEFDQVLIRVRPQ